MTNVLARPVKTLFDARDDVEEDAIDRTVKLAVLDALRDHKRAGNPVAVWEDGKVKIVPPEDIILPDEDTL